MKKALMFITLLWLATVATAGVFVTIDLACGTTTSVYTNFGTTSETITIQGTDKCTGADSEVQLLNENGTVRKRFTIKDRTTKTFRITVPGSESLNFVCNGESGGCSYQISVP